MIPKTTLIKLISTQMLFALILLVTTVTAQNPKAVAGAQYHLKCGNAYAAQEKWHRALAEYDQALVMNDRNAAAYDARGLTWLALEDFGMALRDFDKAIKLAPDLAAAYAHRGQALLAKSHSRDAERAFARTRKLKPEPNVLGALHGNARQ